jgi:hypothetical protein
VPPVAAAVRVIVLNMRWGAAMSEVSVVLAA